MKLELAPERWLRGVFFATALVFACVLVYIYALRFTSWLEADDAVMVLLADRALHAHSPVVADWYYANGDVWVVGPHLIALLPVALLGVGVASIVVSLLVGFALQLAGFVKAFGRLGAERWVAVLAAITTSMAWSSAHVAYDFIELAYAFVTCLYVMTFTLFATLAETEAPRRRRFVLVAVMCTAIAIQNPIRAFAYLIAPVLAMCAWPWRTLPIRRRVAIAVAALAGWVAAYGLYRWVIAPAVTFSVPPGHTSVALVEFAQIKANLGMLFHGLVGLCGGGRWGVRAIPGALLLVGALALVVRELLASRALTARRFVSGIVLVQLAGVLVLLVFGNLLTDKASVRYLMPSMLALLGLAVVIAVPAAADRASVWGRRLAVAWLVVLPLAAMVGALDAVPPRPQKYIRPNAPELQLVADELVRRDLTFGYAINVAANVITVDSHGAAMACPVYFSDTIVPHRWLADPSCFDVSRIPPRFFIVADEGERERKAIGVTLPAPVDKFTVGKTYEVYVFQTAGMSFGWLDPPPPAL